MPRLRRKVNADEYYVRHVFTQNNQRIGITYQVSGAGAEEFCRMGIREGDKFSDFLLKKFIRKGLLSTDKSGTGAQALSAQEADDRLTEGEIISKADYEKLTWETREWMAQMLISFPGCRIENLKSEEDGGISFQLSNVPVQYLIGLYEFALKFDGTGFIEQLESAFKNRFNNE